MANEETLIFVQCFKHNIMLL